jgi:hypothetical protein
MTPPTSPPGWYDDPEYPSSFRYWDGWRWTEHRAPKPSEDRVQPPGRPGWKKDPNDPALMRYWDGTQWDDATIPRPLKSSRSLRSGRRPPRQEMQASLFITSVVVGIGLTAWAVAIGPTREGPPSERCRYPSPPVDLSGWSWLAWLAVVAAAAVVVRGGWRSVRPWRQVLAVCGVVAVWLTFPITMLFFVDLDRVSC